ncbi:heme NO-binding domain-containing protein [Chitinilyticum piscinae]|uniref:Heme NO-binding domain-containing protein n=1 Tax=Chitinilyticum piscinae TaxID=2866724 RepID=A0A8J7FNY5_9NEIS|nr:heme NO-binding domain-containing protein [Chitinilyticum piscinae]MBE9609554.1 heme NO-binding domain-containing protein [Chitinilyticum piscinae]
MYGIVNKAIQEMVTSRFGEEVWQRVSQRAGIADEDFLSHQPYPDQLTYQLVGAVCEETGMEATPVLEAFGSYWVLETGRARYGGLLEAGGHTLSEFLLNLPNFHARICLIYPELQPPEFLCEATGDNQIRVRYFSQRPGLAPFVRGLLLGVGELYATSVDVIQQHSRTSQDDFDEFLVSWRER